MQEIRDTTTNGSLSSLYFLNRQYAEYEEERNFDMNILIVDDEESLRKLTARYTSDAGHMPVLASSGQEGLDSLSVFDIDMVILDVNMAEMDGFETCEKMREMLQDRWIPIIFLSANTDTEHYERGITAGADDYLLKPANPVTLRAKINAMARLADINAKLEEAYAELERTTLIDSLTQVTTRKGFFDHAELCVKNTNRERDPLSILMLDVDYFKPFNDNYGHVKGDEVLRAVAKAVDDKAKRPLDMLARYGGEEFVAVLPNTAIEGAMRTARKMCLAVADLKIPHEYGGDIGIVTVSVGVCCCSDTRKYTLKDIISKADRALYASKQNGRNQVSLLDLDP